MNESQAAATAPTTRSAQRRKGLILVTLAVLVIGAGAALYAWLVLAGVESTNNAYVQGNIVLITPQVAGTVVAVSAEDTERVESGRVLVKLDPADARLALDAAETQLAQAVREARGVFAGEATLAAQVVLRETEVVRAATDVKRFTDDLSRRAPLVSSGSVSAEEVEHTRSQLASARAAQASAEQAVVAAREQLAASRVTTEGLDVRRHPAVERAAARVRDAWLALARCELRAPVSGVVARRSVQLGQRVAAGTPLMAVVALDTLWVDANFKEVQIGRLRIGQPARLKADVYGKRVEFHGRVAGFGAGTGAAFALLPAQNATGNWIKIVQRVPVRIALDAAQLKEHPLRVGLSMEVEVDVRAPAAGAGPQANSAAAPATAASSPSAPATTSPVFDPQVEQADARVREIIAAHLGPRARRDAQARPARPAAAPRPTR